MLQKNLFTLALVAISYFSCAQKANDDALKTNFDVTADDKLISDDYRQKILLNYVQG